MRTVWDMGDMADAEARLSRLVDAVLRGDEVILARAGEPLVRLVPVPLPVDSPHRRELGFLPLPMPDERFAPLDDPTAWQ